MKNLPFVPTHASTNRLTRRSWLAAFGAPAALAGDWPQWLGPGRNGWYTDADFNWKGGKLKTLWTRDVGAGFAAPVASGGKLYLFHRVGGKVTLEVMDPLKGKKLFSTDYATTYRDDFGFDEGPRSAPTVREDRVFTYDAEGVLTAFDAAGGKRLWQVNAMQKYGAPKGYFGAACCPLVFENKVLVNVGSATNAGIVAFDVTNGQQAWQAINDEASYSSPVLATLAGQPAAVFFTRTGLVVVDPRDGKARYQMRWRARSQASVNAATPIVNGEQIFLTASYGTGAALLDVSSGQIKSVWSNDDSLSCHYATPVLHDGHLYGYHGRQETGAELRCVAWKTGEVKWSVDRYGAGSILLVNRQLLMVRETGEVVLAEASPAAYKPIGKHQALEATVRAYPAVANGILYIRSDKQLTALRPA